ncbi:MAG TPA: hypothetical protein VN739_08210, partial [Nitrososphaerales archaeon]|nr:hypothetical protein [Nitrososphaerales archaeon]
MKAIEPFKEDKSDLKPVQDAGIPASTEYATNELGVSGNTKLRGNNQVGEPEAALANIERAALLISNAKSLDEAFALKSLIKETEIRARKKGLVDVEHKAIEYRYWIDDKIGEILESMKETGERKGPVAGYNTRKSTVKTLKDLGVTNNESSRLQKFHRLSAEEKQQIIEKAKENV